MYLEVLESRTLLAGVTILTHGNEGNITGWISAAADAMQERIGGTSAASIYVMKVGSDGVESLKLKDGNKPFDQTSRAEAIIEMDWSSIADTSHFTDDVAANVANFILNPGNGSPDFTQLPFHLIGHSRGASLMVALSFDLGQRGIWVDQVTNLDPHPIGQIKIPFIGTFGDAKMRTYDNVIFSDTYYRNGGSDIIDPHGQAVDGSHNLNLKNSVQAKHEFSAHMSVTAYYHGTIDFNAIENNDALVHDSWYDHSADKPPRDQVGFYYSALVAGKRPADGIGTNFGGTGVRSSVKVKGTQWPNIVNAGVKGTNTVDVNQPITLVASYNDSDSSAKVTFFFDKDHNPYNSNTALSLGAKSVASTSGSQSMGVDATLSNLHTGAYFLGAKITDPDGHTRYTYAVHAINVVHADFASFKDGVVTVSGTSRSDTIEISRTGKGLQSVMHIMRNGVLQTLSAPNVGYVSIDAGEGNDIVVAGAGAPRMYVYGNKGNDMIRGGAGDDTLIGGTGTNQIEGRDGNDSLVGSNGSDGLFGGRGNDTLLGGPGNDTLDGGSGVDSLDGGDGNNVLLNA